MICAHILRVPSVYVAEFKNGIVKIGCSRNTRSRIESLSNYCERIGFGRPIRLHIEYVFNRRSDRECFSVEAGALRTARRICAPYKGSEFFADLRFGEAVNAAKQAVSRHSMKTRARQRREARELLAA